MRISPLRVGVLKSLRIGKLIVFIKTLKKSNPDLFMHWVMKGDSILLIEELQSRISAFLGTGMPEFDSINIVNRIKHHYSSKFEKVYRSHDTYLNNSYD